VEQGSFFRRQNTEGLTLVGLFMEGTTLTCLETYSNAKKEPCCGGNRVQEPTERIELSTFLLR
jgi:hypothetical protein